MFCKRSAGVAKKKKKQFPTLPLRLLTMEAAGWIILRIMNIMTPSERGGGEKERVEATL